MTQPNEPMLHLNVDCLRVLDNRTPRQREAEDRACELLSDLVYSGDIGALDLAPVYQRVQAVAHAIVAAYDPCESCGGLGEIPVGSLKPDPDSGIPAAYMDTCPDCGGWGH